MSQNRPGGVFSGLRMGGTFFDSLDNNKKNSVGWCLARALTYTYRGGTGKGAGWPHWGNEGDAIHPVQDRWQWLLWRRLSDQIVSQRGRCCHQASSSGQTIQGELWTPHSLTLVTNRWQNRELQIMRIVRHPNIVELKAFYYSNGERVCGPSKFVFCCEC